MLELVHCLHDATDPTMNDGSQIAMACPGLAHLGHGHTSWHLWGRCSCFRDGIESCHLRCRPSSRTDPTSILSVGEHWNSSSDGNCHRLGRALATIVLARSHNACRSLGPAVCCILCRLFPSPRCFAGDTWRCRTRPADCGACPLPLGVLDHTRQDEKGGKRRTAASTYRRARQERQHLFAGACPGHPCILHRHRDGHVRRSFRTSVGKGAACRAVLLPSEAHQAARSQWNAT